MDNLPSNVQATIYTIFPSGVDPDDLDPRTDPYSFTITVERRAPGRWAVMRRGHWCLGVDEKWSYESIPSERRDEWLAEHRFDLETALALAVKYVDLEDVMGMTWTQWAHFDTLPDNEKDAYRAKCRDANRAHREKMYGDD